MKTEYEMSDKYIVLTEVMGWMSGGNYVHMIDERHDRSTS